MQAKSVELFFRGAMTRLGRSSPTRIMSVTSCIKPNSKILLLRHDRLGDAIITIPLLRVLRTRCPDMRIDVLLSQYNFSLAPRLQCYANHCWKYEKSPLKIPPLLSALRAARYDAVVDLMDNASATSSMLIKLIDAPSIGIEKPNAEIYAYLVPMLDRNSTHIIDRIAQTLLPFGIDPQRESFHLEYPLSATALETAKQRLGEKHAPYRLGVNISARETWRDWGKEKFVAFIRAFKAQCHDAQIMLLCTANDFDKAQFVSQATNSAVAPPTPTLDDFAAMLVQCDMLLTPDTSIVHIAAAWNIPQVVLYSRTEGLPMPWLPYHAPHRALETSSDFINAISVEEVLAAALSLWHERFSSNAPAIYA